MPMTDAKKSPDDATKVEAKVVAQFSELVAEELGLESTAGIVGSKWIEQPPRQLFGIALSGGGIRSATFNLGLLQGLQELNFLRGFDYLSTVSGGGYTGSFWSLWRKHHPGHVFPDVTPPAAAEPHEILHLRKFSRFLSPTLGVFSYDTGRMIVALINAMVPSMVGAATFLVIALAISLMIAWWILVLPMKLASWLGFESTGTSYHVSVAVLGLLTMLGFSLLHLKAMRGLWKESTVPGTTRLMGIALSLAMSVLWAAWLWFHPLMPSVSNGTLQYLGSCGSTCDPLTILDAAVWKFAFAPGLILLLVPAISALFRVLDKGRSGALTPLARIADQINSWFMFAAAAWIGLTLLWWLSLFIYTTQGKIGNLTLAGIPLAGAVTWLGKFVNGKSKSSEKPWERLGRWAVGLASYLVLSIIVVGFMLLLIGVHHGSHWALLSAITAMGLVYVFFGYDPNRVGLHDFYRGRIARSYGGASHAKNDTLDDATAEQSEDDASVTELPVVGLTLRGPTHLIVCAANDLTPASSLTSMSRGAQSAVLSGVGWTVGDRMALWPKYKPLPVPAVESASEKTAREANEVKRAAKAKEIIAKLPKISAAVTASGAAFNTQMGAKSKLLGPATSFVMSALGMRLGLWISAPRKLDEKESVVRARRGLSLLSELLGRSDSRKDDWVFLSDGGHFENTGMYELIKRHCRYIIVADCGEDGQRAFDDLGSAVRRVREDFGVDIKINLDALKPAANGISRQAMVAGDIHYPDGDTGTLLILKPSITGAEPPDILQYHARNANFPHQSTGDQFFDEAQWESYRRLGLHVARTAFASSRDRHPTLSSTSTAKDDSYLGVRDQMARAFGVARREWLAMPSDYSQRVDRLARAVSSLDAIAGKSGSRLAREIYWELSGASPADIAKPGTGETDASVAADDHVAALSALRQALVVFESIFLSEQLAVNFNQPMYIGIMNMMARWMSAPLTRDWWPLLSSTCGVAFRQFVDSQFLPTAGKRTIDTAVGVTTELTGLASRNRNLEVIKDLTDLKTYVLTLTLAADSGVCVFPRSARSLEVARLDATVSSTTDPKYMIWDARDLYVPPGLWGIGLGSALLNGAKSASSATDTNKQRRLALYGTTQQFVFVRSFWTGTPEDKKDSADLQQLYLDAGFANAEAHAFQDSVLLDAYKSFYTRWSNSSPHLPAPADLIAKFDADSFTVLVRTLSANDPKV